VTINVFNEPGRFIAGLAIAITHILPLPNYRLKMAIQNQYNPQSSPHPGETLAEKLEEMKMSPKEFALRTGKPEKTIIAVMKGESAITADMAVQFEQVTRIPANFWMNHQKAYDEYIAREKRKATIEEAVA
jgi:HTH-type transcriptional regulator/antitoxin HigA